MLKYYYVWIMNVAVCFSGQIRSLDQTYESIENFLKNSFKKFTIFAHIPKDDSSVVFNEYFPNAKTLYEKDKMYIPTKLKKDQFKSVRSKFNNSLSRARKAHMLQLYGIYKANELKKQHEIKNNLIFDWVIRCRSDLKFYTDSINLDNLDSTFLYTPNFHQWEGINDRFILSSSENMDIFCDLFNYLKKNTLPGFNAETIFKSYLNINKIENREIDIKFNRIRSDKTELNDF